MVFIIEDNFLVLKKEDTSNRLDDDEFGYGSIYYYLKYVIVFMQLSIFLTRNIYKREV